MTLLIGGFFIFINMKIKITESQDKRIYHRILSQYFKDAEQVDSPHENTEIYKFPDGKAAYWIFEILPDGYVLGIQNDIFHRLINNLPVSEKSFQQGRDRGFSWMTEQENAMKGIIRDWINEKDGREFIDVIILPNAVK